MEHCELVPGRGIRRGNIDIFFGMPRKKLRDALGWKSSGENIWDDEDEYTDEAGHEWLRLRFLDDKLCDVEVLHGRLMHEGIELRDTTMSALRAALKQGGMALEKTEWLSEGHDCVDLQIVVASKEDTGDVGDEIDWVITSCDFRVE
ncbi:MULTISPECIES: hypothetical protein [unclassified Luteibacter]|uniref:hypothetical protein n=1 Tax=unclassified Luteibacter TaxID=2620188 RepID=UPI0008AB7013|nr:MULTISPECIES: hypothetical protein [unclassified Luteibacter]MDR6937801.1 hypothetical protein [Luteibacter sp. 3190]SEW26920.1 hypothetical protein SAMN04515660_3470 [Luteibacter sp. 329MFSha]